MDEQPAAQEAIRALLHKLEELSCDFSSDTSTTLAPYVLSCLRSAPGDGGWLLRVFETFGWDGRCFARPVEVLALGSRLKALMFDGLQQKGQGSYATVYKARDRLTGEVITLKKLKIEEHGEEGLSGAAIREVSLLKDLQHPNIVRLKDVLWDSRRLYLIMEYLDYDLQEYMAANKPLLPASEIKMFLHQLLSGLHFCHSHRILHRDLKPQNILVDRSSKLLKIADFGLARCFTPPFRAYTHEVITLLYRPPEILMGTDIYTTAVDIWSLGCIFAELFLGYPLFQGDSEIGQLYKIFEVFGTPNDVRWPGVSRLQDWQPQFPQWDPLDLHEVIPRMDSLGLDLLRQLMRYEPSQRISARQALQHPYFADLPPRGAMEADASRTPVASEPAARQEEAAACHEPEALPHVLPGIRAVKLSEVVRSHSDPGLRRVLEKGEQLVDTAQLEPDGLGIQVCSHLSRQAEQQQQQQQIPSKSTSKPATRSLGHAADAAAAAGTAGGRTMRTRSMTAAQEAAQNGLAACGILGSEATGPAMPLAADEPDHEPSEVTPGEEAARESKPGRQRAKGKAKSEAAMHKSAHLAEANRSTAVSREDSNPPDSSDLSDQTVCDLTDEVVPRRKTKA